MAAAAQLTPQIARWYLNATAVLPRPSVQHRDARKRGGRGHWLAWTRFLNAITAERVYSTDQDGCWIISLCSKRTAIKGNKPYPEKTHPFEFFCLLYFTSAVNEACVLYFVLIQLCNNHDDANACPSSTCWNFLWSWTFQSHSGMWFVISFGWWLQCYKRTVMLTWICGCWKTRTLRQLC